ncbi:MAG TPA: helicase-related protein [Geminicoccaceae bacterium]|nr:helicase-related protein [Geminicoccus sp.]HMU53256.1 helicase-related protein [Geminicoccaceae bacterium]
MAREPLSGGRIVAVLGPTNTGKTHFAVERMLAHPTGMMGFPLRLLAREIYDRIVALKGADAVALITGEEKIGSDSARYVVATVEAMPLQRRVSFLAVDEIQLCADYERGHVFTDRLLRARGLDETMFLGSDTMRPLLRQLLPEAEIVGRPRFSVLRHAGHVKPTRLPRRSAIVAFTSADVYALGELMRRQRGGAAVVLGALSPRTRNAQVAMYQAGEVEHLVATDAIGMGLNMDLAHVAFAEARKFDGRMDRRLTAPEMAQIAGRAGRYMADGTFGTTNGCPLLDDRLVEAIETHSFPALKALRWRNADLDFGSLDRLAASLDRRPPFPFLIKVRDALDDRSLGLLGNRPEIRARADSPERIRLLWQVCQIPDFSKSLSDSHLHLLATVFGHLTGGRGVLPADWVAAMIARLDRVEGDVDALVGRIAHVRTWTYLSHRADWLDDAPHWQARAREVEDRLSDALHERLTQRFVDRRTTALLRSMRDRGGTGGRVEQDGSVEVDGHVVGELRGLVFRPAATTAEVERKVAAAAARRVLTPELARRARAIAGDGDDAFVLDEDEEIRWHDEPLARLLRGREPRRPRLELLASEELRATTRAVLVERLERWTEGWLSTRLRALDRLAAAAGSADLGGAARGIAFTLVEELGSAERRPLEPLLADLGPEGHAALTRLGVRFGRLHLYLPDLLKPGAIEARRRIVRLSGAGALPAVPPGRTVLRRLPAALPAAAWRRIGYAAFGDLALRVDSLERLAAGLRARGREQGAFALPAELAAAAGLGRAELAAVAEALGFRPETAEGSAAVYRAAARRAARPGPPPARAKAGSGSPFAALAALKAAP